MSFSSPGLVVDLVGRHFASGDALWTGAAFACAGLGVRLFARGARGRFAALCMTAGGCVLIAFSAAPLPYTLYALWLSIIMGAWLLGGRSGVIRYAAVILAAGFSLGVCLWELGYHRAPEVCIGQRGRLYVIGDSLSMGSLAPEGNWPERLGARLGLETENYAFGGATVAGAIANAERIKTDDALVILAVGGNDLLGGNFAGFRDDLRALMQAAHAEEREIVLIELPLPPFHNVFGRAQRALAAEYGVTLIPKRHLARVLFTPGATYDGIPLTDDGHEQLAETMAQFFRARCDDSDPT